MSKISIEHNAEKFRHYLALHLGDPEHGGVMGAVDVISRDEHPGELLLVVRDHIDWDRWYASGKVYTRYQHAFAALGAALDGINPQHARLSDTWER